ncbi:cofilin [Lobulomyces angularis]|nr:cofilin [Lobulomyces angularis]
MSSGVQVTSHGVSQYEDMKLKRKYNYIVYEIIDDSIQATHVHERTSNNTGTEAIYNEFISHFPADEGRFGVFDLEYQTPNDGIRSKLLFFLWAPDSAKIKSRMIYASSKLAIRQKLDGIHSEMQCTDLSELAFDEVFSKIAPEGSAPLNVKEE